MKIGRPKQRRNVMESKQLFGEDITREGDEHMARAEYAENVQKSLVALYYRGNTKYSICKEYGIPRSLLDIWIEKYSGEEIETNEVLSFLQVRELKKQKETLQEEISALSEAINLFENNYGK